MESYERLLGAMPYIAEVVNRFRSPEVQRRAFEALLAALDAGPGRLGTGRRAPRWTSTRTGSAASRTATPPPGRWA